MTSKQIEINDKESLFSENSDLTQTSVASANSRSVSETTPSSNVSMNTLTTTMEQIRFNELRKKHVANQRMINDQIPMQPQQEKEYAAPTIVRRHVHNNYSNSASTVSTTSDQSGKSVICDHEQFDEQTPYTKYS